MTTNSHNTYGFLPHACAFCIASYHGGCGRVNFDYIHDGGDGPFDSGEESISLTVTMHGDGAGTIRSMPVGIQCPPNCDAEFSPGAVVTLTATSAGENSFQGWLEVECVAPHDCTIQLDSPTMVGAHFFGPRNRIFVSRQRQSLSPTFVADADTACNDEARDAGMTGTFVAYLSTSAMTARERLGSAVGWLRPDGRAVSDSLDPQVPFFAAPMLHADGQPALNSTGAATVVTGSTASGELSDNCNDFGDMLGVASRGITGAIQSWAIQHSATLDCSSFFLRFYCVQTDFAQSVVAPPQNGRIAFLSSPGVDPSTGLQGADAACQRDADSAGLTGSYQALLATSGASALSRFDTSGVPWVTASGTILYNSSDDLTSGAVTRPVATTANGDPVLTGTVFTGAPSPDVVANLNCSDWSVANAATRVSTTFAFRADGLFIDFSASDCANSFARIHCFEM